MYAQLDLDFSHTRGYYNTAFQLEILCDDPNASIKYTTDGSLPSPLNGINYSTPITINSNATIRVYAYNAVGENKSKTHTYLFPNEVKNESYMGTFITNDPILGPQFEAALLDIPTVSVVTPNTIDDANPLAGSFEFFFAKKDLSSQEDCGIKLFGATSTTAPKNSHRIYFRSEFGSTSLDEKLFADVNNGSEAVTSFDQIELRADNQESFQNNFLDTRTYIGPRFLDNTMLAMGHVHSQGRYVHFFKNGEYRGQYYLRERMNDDFM